MDKLILVSQRLQQQRDKLLVALKEFVESHGYTSYISNEEKEQQDEVINARALIAEIEAGK